MVIALLTVSAFAVSTATRAEAAPAPGALPSVPPTITPLTYYGAPTTSYSAGLQTGQVFFSVTDTSGDTSAVVQINDQNATRDGLTNPVASFTVKFNAGTTNSSYTWDIYYLIPITLTYGGQWNITANGAIDRKSTR